MPTRPAVVIVAAGRSTRTAADKLFSEVAGRPLLAQTLAAFAGLPLVLVGREDMLERLHRLAPEAAVVAGGTTRTESELAGLEALSQGIESGEIDVVAVHDGARPFPSRSLIERVLDTAAARGGAVPSLPITDRLVREDAGALITMENGALHRVQTPQAFRAGPLLAAYRQAASDGFEGPDTASTVQRYTDLKVELVPGEQTNLKVTYSDDLAEAERIARSFR